MTSTVVWSLGSNQGDRLATLQAAVDALAGTPGIAVDAVSSVYETAPWGPVEQPDFLNIVVIGSTTLVPGEVLGCGLDIEDALGRVRAERWGPRTLDIDVIAFGDLILDTPELTVPHVRAHERAFVLVPWLEVDPDAVLAGRGPVRELTVSTDGVRRRADLAVTS